MLRRPARAIEKQQYLCRCSRTGGIDAAWT